MGLHLDPDPDDSYQRVPPAVARWADRVFDWLEETPTNTHAQQHPFTIGVWAVRARIGGDDWLILWERDGPDVVVRYLDVDMLNR